MTTDNTSREAFAQAVRQFEAALLAANQILIDGAVSPELLELEAARKRLLCFQHAAQVPPEPRPPIAVSHSWAVLTRYDPSNNRTKPSRVVIRHGDDMPLEWPYNFAHDGPWNHNEALRKYCDTHEIGLEGWVRARLRNCAGYAFVQLPAVRPPQGDENVDHNPT